ncbi:MAG: hypothetical protein JNJ83_10870 [Verrucomicrobiaceae bacterium]|nr:hypothetical protein [Verrucomicrobiaceae bacterium]
MTRSDFLALVGTAVSVHTISGVCGECILTAHGYIVADPCYMITGDAWSPFLAALYAAFPSDPHRFGVAKREWAEMSFCGAQILVSANGGDGPGIFGLGCDAGMFAAFKLADSAKLAGVLRSRAMAVINGEEVVA